LRSELGMSLRIAFLTLALAYYVQPQAGALMIAPIMAFFMYWYEGTLFIQKLLNRKVLRPNIRSFRNLLIIGISLLIILSPLAIFLVWLATQTDTSETNIISQIISQLLPREVNGATVLSPEYVAILFVTIYGLVSDLCGPLWVMLGVFLTWPLSAIKRKLVINRAKLLMQKRPNLKVVAVTGSYGKSTTKELIYQILQKKFKTVKTEKNNNTDIGIALTILKKINKSTEVFVAEMGAYKIGETRECCQIARPDIAIIPGWINSM